MKKTYVKPELAIESFVLNQNIASCEGGYNSIGQNSSNIPPMGQTNHYNAATCVLNIGYIVFSNNSCSVQDGDVEDFCYQAPDGTLLVFGS